MLEDVEAGRSSKVVHSNYRLLGHVPTQCVAEVLRVAVSFPLLHSVGLCNPVSLSGAEHIWNHSPAAKQGTQLRLLCPTAA